MMLGAGIGPRLCGGEGWRARKSMSIESRTGELCVVAKLPMRTTLMTSSVLLVAVGVASAKPVTITYWEPWAGVYRAVNKTVIDAFNKEHEGRILVNIVQVPDVEEKVLTAMAGGAAPDLFKLDRFKVGSYAARNVIEPLDAYIKKDKIRQDAFFTAPWAENVYAGKTYGLPWNTDSRAMWYNKTLFKNLGLDYENPPKTWEEVNLTARKIDMVGDSKFQRVGFVPSVGNWFFLGWLWAAGGEMTSADGRKVAWDSEPGLRAANLITDAIMKYGGPNAVPKLPTDPTSGKLGMWMEGSFWVGYLKDSGAMKKFDFGAGAPPRPAGLEKDATTWSGGFSLAIPKGAKHPKEAWEFMKYYCGNRAAQALIGVQSGQIPALKEAAYDERFIASHPTIKTFVNLLQKGRFRTVLPCGQQLWEVYNDELMDILTKGKKGPAEALTYTSKKAQLILDRAWARARAK